MDQPHFTPRKRYVVLTKADLGSPANDYEPIINFNQGAFLLEAEKDGGPPVVSQMSYPVTGYRGGHLVFGLNPRESALYPYALHATGDGVTGEVLPADTEDRFDEKRFLDLIRKLVKER